MNNKQGNIFKQFVTNILVTFYTEFARRCIDLLFMHMKIALKFVIMIKLVRFCFDNLENTYCFSEKLKVKILGEF